MADFRAASGSIAEDLFIEIFSDTFGAEKAGFLYSQYPFYDISIPKGIHSDAQVALDETWSALRFVDNVPGETYERPGKK